MAAIVLVVLTEPDTSTVRIRLDAAALVLDILPLAAPKITLAASTVVVVAEEPDAAPSISI